MSKALSLLLLMTPMIASAAEEAPAIPFSATVRQDAAAPRTIEVAVPAGTVETVDLRGGLLLEFTAPADPLDFAMVRLLRRQDDAVYPVHTTRQPLADNSTLANNSTPPAAYLICDGEASFYSPPPQRLPECPGS